MIETGWVSLLPPLIAITLALITKEVYSSLFAGLLSGMIIYACCSGGGPVSAVSMTFDMMYAKIADNAYMIIFLALLWAVVLLVSRSGGSEAYGRWAGKRLKNKRSAAFATSLLGILIFIDDGFNCLTVGTVMRPITDRLKISREKLAYIIDATAAPVCIIAPVSSWAVAVASEVSESGGFHVFLSTIPYNLYALLTIFMVFFLAFTGRDFGPMKKAEAKAAESEAAEAEDADAKDAKKQGRVIDLVLPILVLIICAILGMAYVGGFFDGVGFAEAIGENPTAGLTLGAFAGLVTAALLYLPRRLMKPKEFIEMIVSGIGKIVPPMLILILSWSLGGVCRQLIGTGVYISGFVSTAKLPLGFLPFLIFVIAALMSFSMGTSWGTFGMLIPIVSMICAAEGAGAYLVPALGATLAGSVYGDHCSPISDTTILSSTGSGCQHIRHVETQLPYATLVAIVCAAGYLIAGFTLTPWIALGAGAVLLTGSLLLLNRFGKE
ncbi:MAG: Na+/H+ antiporter NhaC family protein [Lachnospiraceae bacterium]|nr:Na+/H+ antiporter NhaC family protein [Lachnospiraceae bacterium]